MILESLTQNDEVIGVTPMSDRPHPRQLAKAAIRALGCTVGERLDHRGWPPDVTQAFLSAEVIRPPAGEIARKLYGDK